MPRLQSEVANCLIQYYFRLSPTLFPYSNRSYSTRQSRSQDRPLADWTDCFQSSPALHLRELTLSIEAVCRTGAEPAVHSIFQAWDPLPTKIKTELHCFDTLNHLNCSDTATMVIVNRQCAARCFSIAPESLIFELFSFCLSCKRFVRQDMCQ